MLQGCDCLAIWMERYYESERDVEICSSDKPSRRNRVLGNPVLGQQLDDVADSVILGL